MPKKTCPKCKKSYGVRQKECECGHVFSGKKTRQKKSGHPLYPEPGAWVIDDIKGMPKISPPPDLPVGKLDTKEVRDFWVAYEGLGYCIYDLLPATKLADHKLRSLWTKARRAMQDVVDYMEN